MTRKPGSSVFEAMITPFSQRQGYRDRGLTPAPVIVFLLRYFLEPAGQVVECLVDGLADLVDVLADEPA